MKIIRLVDAKMNLKELEVLSKICKNYAFDFVDFTARQNLQFHYIKKQDILEAPKLNNINLGTKTSKSTSNDALKLVSSCAVSSIDKDEIYDVKKIVKDVNDYFLKNSSSFADFPRKFKMGISGCKSHCSSYEIQDVAFTAFKKQNGEVVFDLTLGGLAKTRQLATRANRYINPNQVLEVAVSITKIFIENIDEKSRNKARLRDLLDSWGIEKFTNEIEKKIGYKLEVGTSEPKITSFENRNHFGINKEKIKGYSYIGFITNLGRVEGNDFSKMYEICKKYSVGGIKLTTTHNFIVYGVKDEVAENLAKEFEALRYLHKKTPFKTRFQSCIGKEFCKFGLIETKKYAKKVLAELEKRFPDFKEDVTISFAGCKNGCSHPQIFDIGFVGTIFRYEGQRVEGFEVVLGGNLKGSKSTIAKKIGLKIPENKVVNYIGKLINDYKTDNLRQKSFKDYLAVLEPIMEICEDE